MSPAADWPGTAAQRRVACTTAVTDAIRLVDPTLEVAAVSELLDRFAKGPTARVRLADELRLHPERLSTDDPHTSPVLARILGNLVEAAHFSFTRPTCPKCGRHRTYGYPRDDGVRLCWTCTPKPAGPCTVCGRIRPVAFRRTDGSGVCNTCSRHEVSRHEACTECGRVRQVATRKAEGPYCPRCYKAIFLDTDARWTGTAANRQQARSRAVVKIVRQIDPGVAEAVIEAAIETVASAAQPRTLLAEYIQDHPDALTCGDTHAPKVVGNLIRILLASGAHGLTQPTCSGCGSEVVLSYVGPNGRICPDCYAAAHTGTCSICGRDTTTWNSRLDGAKRCDSCAGKRRLFTCSDCGRRRRSAGQRDGKPLCSMCRSRDPNFHKKCSKCGRARAINARVNGQPLCSTCYRPPLATCNGCGRERPINAHVDGDALCRSCYQGATGRCTRCHDVGICRRTRSPIPPVDEWDLVCLSCLVRQRLTALLTGTDGAVAEHWAPLTLALFNTTNPASVLEWLRQRLSAKALRHLAGLAHPPTHADLDQYVLQTGRRQSAEHARALLVAVEILDSHDERRARLELRVKAMIDSTHPADQQLLQRYSRWQLMPHLIRRSHWRQAPISAKNLQALTIVSQYLSHLRARGVQLTDLHQPNLDRWIIQHPSHLQALRTFLTWAHRNQQCARMDLPSVPKRAPTLFIDTERRWELARAAVHGTGPALKWEVDLRAAAILVLLYGQMPVRIVTLTHSHLGSTPSGDRTLKLGTEAITLPTPVSAVLASLPARPRDGLASSAPPGSWLFPGRNPGAHQSAETLAKRLHAVGIPARASRNTTLNQLAQEAPSVILADLLGISISTAENWRHTSGARWNTYSAIKTTDPGGDTAP